MKYKVNIDYRKGPSFGMELDAPNEELANLIARQTAEFHGFIGKIKKITVRKEEEES